MPESQTVGLIIAGVVVVAAVVVVGVVLSGKSGSDKVTTIVRGGPRAWAQPWTWGNNSHPYYDGSEHRNGGDRHGGGGRHH
jgi:hypothetical protein